MPTPWFPQASDTPLETGEMVLAAQAAAVPDARQFALSMLYKWDLDELSDSCALVVSELITNAVAATGGLASPNFHAVAETSGATVVLKMVRTASCLVVEVRDTSHEVPVPTAPDDVDESGRGLMLVAALTDSWDYYPSADGKAVWGAFKVSTPPIDHSEAPAHEAPPGGLRTTQSPETEVIRHVLDGKPLLDRTLSEPDHLTPQDRVPEGCSQLMVNSQSPAEGGRGHG